MINQKDLLHKTSGVTKISLPKSGFNLEATLDSGQVFGFRKMGPRVTPEGEASAARSPNASYGRARRSTEGGRIRGLICYEGMVNGFFSTLWQEKGVLCVERIPDSNFTRAIRMYFDFDRDLSPLYRVLKSDERLSPAYRAFRGLRLIHQESWEALASFILSSNNNVKRVQGIWQNLAAYFGGKLVLAKKGPAAGVTRFCHHTFPSAEQIAKSHEWILKGLGLGYRASFLLHTARFVAANPVCLEAIREAPYEEAKERVLAFPGIGEKVADCVLLYGFQKFEAFPVDVWILRVMRKLYFGGRKAAEKKIRAFAQKRWGGLAGYVQQYLFHGARKGVYNTF